MAKLVKVVIEQGKSGAYFATSPDLDGLDVARMTIKELREAVPEAIACLYAARGISVSVSPVEENDEFDCQWVAVPTDAPAYRARALA